jgi:hypothetical protein
LNKKKTWEGFFFQKKKYYINGKINQQEQQEKKKTLYLQQVTQKKMDPVSDIEPTVKQEVTKSPKKRERKHYMLMYRLEARIENMTKKLNKLIALRPV